MFPKRWWKDELCAGIVFLQLRWCKPLDRFLLPVRIAVRFATTSGRTVFFATPTSAVSRGFGTGLVIAERLSGVENRSVSSATAQVAVESAFNFMFVGVCIISQKRIKALVRRVSAYVFHPIIKVEMPHHHDTRSAEAALAAISHRHPFLGGMGILYIAYTLYRDDMLSVDTDERSKASIHRGMVDLLDGRIPLRDDLGSRVSQARLWR